ncbi:ATPase, T2SS/T4P/T4SS family [Lentzea sp. BCCO 10_0061]|uniref:ATPase, T2SS/T4P/T4SS family n=1 Tax=Lentzea sokolovensis TaxID=3095429 RepID=A0ABU4V9J7_9PSEU|nr:ATPase, T2SS/T4P/T4SS family [Lentzea sp. BCCO 10_0061]MDX8148419.1 ATPase, T2SS/T4P/T4SS family [Lentzea sp. BCCO 10_0061]
MTAVTPLSGVTDLPFPRPMSDVRSLRERLRNDVTDQLSARLRADGTAERPPLGPLQRRQLAEALLRDSVESIARKRLQAGLELFDADVERRAVAEVLAELFGAGRLDPLLADTSIENINVNGADQVFVKRADGTREMLPPIVDSDDDLVHLIRTLAARSGIEERRFDNASPIVNFALPSGERVSAVMTVTARPSVSIRRHRLQRVNLGELRDNDTIGPGMESFLAALVRARKNVLVTGGTTIGKTTLLRALASAIPAHERLITIEDVFELGLDQDPAHADVVALQAREPNLEGVGAITLSDLVWQSLRMQPDRVIVGEVRGPEVIPLTNAMSMGNDGSMGTLHASSSAGAFTKLGAYAVQGPERLTLEATNLLVASALHFVVHLDLSPDRCHRVVSSVREVVDADGRQIISNEVWRPGPDLRAVPAAPLRSRTLDELIAAGYDRELVDRWGS